MEQRIFDPESIIMVFVVALLISFVMTPVSMRLAKRVGAMDIPKDDRRMHTDVIPRFGGLAIFLGSMTAIWLFAGYDKNIRTAILCGTLMYMLGAVDDIKSLKAKPKFIGQFVIAIIAYASGIRIKFIANYFGGEGKVILGTTACFIITVLWIVGITNTINLIDGLDGLAAGVSAIICVCMAYVAYIHGNIYGMVVVCTSLMAIAGACIGFLPYNFSPAKTFMGDSGALYLGFMIATLSVISPLKRATLIATAVPVIALAVPIFDTFMAMARRILRRQSIMVADKEHLHHRLISQGYDQRRSVIMLYGITGIMGVAAILMSRELYVDAFMLIAVVASYLYVFATDPVHRRMYGINKVRTARQRRTARASQKDSQIHNSEAVNQSKDEQNILKES
ncbi:MAG: undecaprenyl/decaprenyl-phosphate alpha-N-acetylglucosaminyl 1-phosphate transferase [Mogibacterium sp.]|nr:undecaprenyl/decaprenyl-phosphate alpha-N-acetylglucosaminyl 1-phosphate transferase [Mogibacterium sp.]